MGRKSARKTFGKYSKFAPYLGNGHQEVSEMEIGLDSASVNTEEMSSSLLVEGDQELTISTGKLTRNHSLKRKMFMKSTIEPMKKELSRLSKRDPSQKAERRNLSREIKRLIEEFDRASAEKIKESMHQESNEQNEEAHSTDTKLHSEKIPITTPPPTPFPE